MSMGKDIFREGELKRQYPLSLSDTIPWTGKWGMDISGKIQLSTVFTSLCFLICLYEVKFPPPQLWPTPATILSPLPRGVSLNLS